MKEIEINDKRTVEEAIEAALEALGITRSNAEIEVLSQGGLFTKPKVRVKAKDSAGARALKFAEQLLEHMGINAIVELTENDEEAKLDIIGTDTSAVMGYRGEVLDALTYLTSLTVNRDEPEGDRRNYKRIVVDCENYRAKRAETLEGLAERMAAKAAGSGRRVMLEPMNPYERRVIHMKLQGSTEVTVHSEGEEPNRFIVIVPNNEKPFNRDRNDRGGRGGRGNDRRGGFNRDRGGRGGNRDRGGRDRARPANAFSEQSRATNAFSDIDLSREGKNYTSDNRFNKG